MQAQTKELWLKLCEQAANERALKTFDLHVGGTAYSKFLHGCCRYPFYRGAGAVIESLPALDAERVGRSRQHLVSLRDYLKNNWSSLTA